MDSFTIISFLILIISIFYLYYRYSSNYWKNKNIPYIITFKTFFDIFLYKKCPAIAFEEIYRDPNTKNEPIVGINVFHRPALVIKDHELIKKILIKDFNYFQDRFSSADPHKDLLGNYNLFFGKNPIWKVIRNKMTPVFTSGKIKQMFILANDVGKELDKHICKLTDNESKTEQEVKNISQLFTIDVIASIAFGVDAHSISNPDADFLKNGREIFNFTRWRSFEFSSMFFLPDLVSLISCKLSESNFVGSRWSQLCSQLYCDDKLKDGLQLFCNRLAFTKKASIFLTKTFRHIIGERERLKSTRHDLIESLLLLREQQKSETNPDKILDEMALISQAATFFIAGFETSSTTMSFALYEIAKHPEIQKRLRQEIKKVLVENNGELTYDIIQNMDYLNMVVQETLRLYPVLPFLDRKYFNAEGKNYSLEPFSNSSIPNGTPVYIPIYSLQRDERYFENPNVFDPERFSIANRDKINPYSSIPFGVGPRNCIGERIGLLNSKIGLVYFLKNHKIEESEHTLKEMKLEKKALLLQLEGGTYCNLVRDPLIS